MLRAKRRRRGIRGRAAGLFMPAAGRGSGQVSPSGQNGIFRREGPVRASV
ncbi:hypothetical protein MBT84_36060 [Streptomyces sp. MBT84]|nr:hypothetical protein [Streptomyces sp. MBT84]